MTLASDYSEDKLAGVRIDASDYYSEDKRASEMSLLLILEAAVRNVSSTGTERDLRVFDWNKVVEPLSYIDNTTVTNWNISSSGLATKKMTSRINIFVKIHF